MNFVTHEEYVTRLETTLNEQVFAVISNKGIGGKILV